MNSPHACNFFKFDFASPTIRFSKGLKVCPCLFNSLSKVISVCVEVCPRQHRFSVLVLLKVVGDFDVHRATKRDKGAQRAP